MKFRSILFLFSIAAVTLPFVKRANAGNGLNGLVIHATEIGVGKFHRTDNKIHSYAASSIWVPSILPSGISEVTPVTVPQKDGSWTVFFSNLDELLTAIQNISVSQKQKIQIINFNGHGMPGGMWYPKDQGEQNSMGCADWRDSASGTDQINYDGYYSAISKSEILKIRQISQTGGSFPCVTGVNSWREVLSRHKTFRDILADDLRIHFLSCVVGLGPVGDAFTKTLAELLAPTKQAQVITSINYGLGDWSMPEGLGFWDYQNDAQLDKDNESYPVDRKDRDQMQKGSIRIASLNGSSAVSQLITELDYLKTGMIQDPGVPKKSEEFDAITIEALNMPLVQIVQIPGTRVQVRRQ